MVAEQCFCESFVIQNTLTGVLIGCADPWRAWEVMGAVNRCNNLRVYPTRVSGFPKTLILPYWDRSYGSYFNSSQGCRIITG